MRKILPIIIFCLSPSLGFAQQCGWSGYHVFVLDIRSEKNNQAIPGLKVTLIDDTGIPYNRDWYATDSRDNITHQWTEPLTFWENSKKRYHHKKCTPPVEYMFERLESEYVAIIYKSGQKSKSKYWIRVEDTDGKSNGGIFPTAYFPLDRLKAIEMCLLTSSHNALKNLHNDTFLPIPIVLKQDIGKNLAIPQKIDGDLFEAGPFQIIHQFRSGGDMPEYYTEDVWIIRDATSLEIKQTIRTKNAVMVPENMKNMLFKTGDFRFNGALGIALLRELEKDPMSGPDRTRYDYYLFDTLENKFEIDPVLSNVFNLTFDPVKKQITQKIRKQMDGYQSIEVLTLGKYNQWQRVSYEEIRTPPDRIPNPYPKYNKTTHCAVWVKDAGDFVPVVDFRSGHQAQQSITDTFRLVNTCTNSITLTATTQGKFSYPTTIAPLDTGVIVFSEVVQNPGPRALLQERYIILRVNNQENLSLTLRFAVAGPENAKIYHANGTLLQADYPSTYAGCVRRLETDSTGSANALGLVRIRDGRRIGNAMVRSAHQSFHLKSYSKLFHLKIDNPFPENPGLLKIAVRENGQWVYPTLDFDTSKKEWTFLLPNSSDSVWVSAGKDSNLMVLKYDELTEEFSFTLGLLSPGTLYLYNPYGRIPISVSKDYFALIWNYEWLYKKYGQSKVPAESVLMEWVFKDLKITPPKYFVFSGGYQNKEGLDLSPYSDKEKKEILRKLQQSPYISKIASVMYMGKGFTTFCNGEVSVWLNYNLRTHQIPEIVNRHGFTMANQGGFNGVVTARYGSKFIDETFVRDMMALKSHPDVWNISMSHYAPVYLDRKE